MGWFILKHIFSTIFTFITIGRLSRLDFATVSLKREHARHLILEGCLFCKISYQALTFSKSFNNKGICRR